MKQWKIDKAARLLVRMGVNLQPGESIVLQADTDAMPLARAITKEAFEAGAEDVEVLINDPWINQIGRAHV